MSSKGANRLLKLQDIDAAATELRRVQTIILQFEVPLDTVHYAVRFAGEQSIPCIVAPTPVVAARDPRFRLNLPPSSVSTDPGLF